MSISLLRLVSLSCSLSLSLVACVSSDSESGSAEPISNQESAMTAQAVEGVVLTMAPITSTSPVTLAASYRAAFGVGGVSCATVDTDDLTYVDVTFACTGPLATTGSIHLQLTSPTTLEATADLAVGGISIDSSVHVEIPATQSSPRTLDASLTIAGPHRMLSADATASWTASGSCVTYTASGSVTAEGLAASGSATFEVDARTVCHP
jgi:hypothetical protein